MTLKKGIAERFKNAAPIINELMSDLEWIEYDFNFKTATEEERTLVKHLRLLSCKPFDEAGSKLNEIFKPIKAKGILFKNNEGCYQIEKTDIYFTCGCSCEVLLPYWDDEDDFLTWIPTTIEAENGQYYFTARSNVKMDGALVRVRG